MTSHDLQVDRLSDALMGKRISLVISGSVGAIESPRLIRSLRRLGASITPYLTRGGRQFTTPTAITWAASANCIENFSGTSSHLATDDACVIAPASAHFIHQIATGALDSPASALVASFLGQKKPVILIPNMHNSLFESPAVQENIKKIASWLIVLNARSEEGKQKFPNPKELADRISHEINRFGRDTRRILITMGTTRGYIDDVRYLSNYSSGALGTEIIHEAYRQGMRPTAVVGPCKIQPTVYSELINIETNQDLEDASLKALSQGCDAAILAASVLDFVPKVRRPGKLSSKNELEVDFEKTKKIISGIHPSSNIKVGFKLETDLTMEKASAIANDYISKYHLSMIVINALNDVDERSHRALVFTGEKGKVHLDGRWDSKRALAAHIIKHIGTSRCLT